MREVERSGEDADPDDVSGSTPIRSHRRPRRFPAAALAAVAAAVLVVGGRAVAGLHRGSTTGPTPSGQTVESTPVPGVTPTERLRSGIPWPTVGEGWTAAAWAATAGATAPVTLYLVSPSGVRYAISRVPPGTTVLDVSPDERRILTTLPVVATTQRTTTTAPAEVSLLASPDNLARFSPLLPDSVGRFTGVVPLAVQGRFAFLALPGCNRPGASLLVYDLEAHAAYPLLGPGANGGTVLSSITLDPGR